MQPQKMTLKRAKAIGISNGNSKMPGTTFATDAFACKVGSRLANVKNSVCSKCYARRIQKMRPNVQTAWARNQENFKRAIVDDEYKNEFVQSASFFIIKKGDGYHRWFDSGDLFSVEQLALIVEICQMTPSTKHWLPTREIKIVRDYQKKFGAFPKNLCVRVSAPLIDDNPLTGFENTSTVHTKQHHGHECPARYQDNNCGDCRACWSLTVTNVSYKKH